MCISGGGGGAVSGGRDLADITRQRVTREVPGLRDFPSPAWRRMSGGGAGDGDLVAAVLVPLGGEGEDLEGDGGAGGVLPVRTAASPSTRRSRLRFRW